MVYEVRMPRIDPNVDEGTVGAWLAEPGQAVGVGEPLMEIITDKATFELEAEVAGVLRRHCATAGSVVPVGYVLALLSDDAAEPVPEVAEENRAILAAYRESLLNVPAPEPAAAGAAAASGAVAPPGPRATPAARRLAAREGIPLDGLAGRAGGVIRRRDVEDEIRRRRGDA